MDGLRNHNKDEGSRVKEQLTKGMVLKGSILNLFAVFLKNMKFSQNKTKNKFRIQLQFWLFYQ